MTIRDPLLNRRQQPRVRNRLEAVGDIRLCRPPPALPDLVDQDLEGVVRRAPRAKPVRALEEVGFEDRLNDDLHSRLHDPVAHRRDRERAQLLAAGLRNEDPASGERTPAPLLQIRGQLVEQQADAVLLDGGDRLSVDAGRATVGAHQLPRPLQDIPAIDLVVERVEPSPGVGLGRPVERPLQFSDSVLAGGTSHLWHSPALPCA